MVVFLALPIFPHSKYFIWPFNRWIFKWYFLLNLKFLNSNSHQWGDLRIAMCIRGIFKPFFMLHISIIFWSRFRIIALCSFSSANWKCSNNENKLSRDENEKPFGMLLMSLRFLIRKNWVRNINVKEGLVFFMNWFYGRNHMV